MKSSLIKTLLLPATIAIASPTIAMASCGGVSQWQIPITIDKEINTVSDTDLETVVDHPGNKVGSYAPKSYVYSFVKTNDTLHAYCSPEDSKNAGKFLEEKYYSINSNDIPTINNEDKEKPIKLYRNINLLQMSNGIISVANNLSHLYSYLLTYQSRSDILFNVENLAKNYGVDATKFAKLYQKGSAENINFFEFNFAINNLLTEGKSKIKFDPSNLNFKFKNFQYSPDKYFGYGPIANSDIEENFVGKIKRINPNNVGEPLSNDIKTNYGYDEHVILTTQKDGDAKMVAPSLVRSIPIPISKISMQESFYDSTETKSFLPNDWFINDKDEINDEINKTNAWNKFEDYTEKKPSVENLSWNVNCSQNSEKNSFTWPTNSDSIFKMYQNDLGYSDFIVLANYSVAAEKPEDDTKPGRTDHSLIFSGVSGIYPAFFFENEEAFVKTEISIPNLEDSSKPEKQDKYFANKEYLDKRLSEMNTALIKHGQNEDVEKLLRYSFMENNGSDWNYDLNKVIVPWLS